MSTGFWTDTRVRILRCMWAEGELSASEIARELGCTRNMVIGKANRLGLAYRDKADFYRPAENVKLSFQIAGSLRKRKRYQGAIKAWAAEFSVDRKTIYKALNGTTWMRAA